MVNTLDFWAFILANTGAVTAGGLLAALSYLAYRQDPEKTSYRLATIGFGLVVLGSLVDPAYLLGWSVDFRLNSHELLVLTAIEDFLIAVGLAVIFLAITKHDPTASPRTDERSSLIDEKMEWRGHEWSDD